MRIILDCEANGLNPDRIWCVVAKDYDTKEVFHFDRCWEDYEPLRQFILRNRDSTFIGHYFLGYDRRVLNSLISHGVEVVKPSQVIDTLVLSRMFDFSIAGGHGLAAWGERFGIAKPEIAQWDRYDPGMLHRCDRDVAINEKLFEKYEKYVDSERWKLPLKIEMSAANFCNDLHQNGFPFDKPAAETLVSRWEEERDEINRGFAEDFKTRFRAIKVIRPVLTKAGTIHRGDFRWYDGDLGIFSVGCPFTLIESVEFNPGSKQQVIDRLWDAGWHPYNRTAGHADYLRTRKNLRTVERTEYFNRYGWKIDEQNLATLPPEAPKSAKKLVRWLGLTGLISQLKNHLSLYNQETGSVRGEFNSIGAWSQRVAHSGPNMANLSKLREVRSLWKAHKDHVLVGCDAAGIQFRVLAHLVNDPDFIQATCYGVKEDGTDIHSVVWKKTSPACPSRDDAKNFNYAYVLGVRPPKVSQMWKCTVPEAIEAIGMFQNSYPGLAELQNVRIPSEAERGYFEGLDGRFVKQSEARLVLAGHLQNGEKVIMSLARMLAEDKMKQKGLEYVYVNWVHDEFQISCPLEQAEEIGMIHKIAIQDAGKILRLNAPMDGEFKVGRSWDETH